MTRLKLLTLAVLLSIAPAAFGNDYGAIRGVVHDPQHRPIQDAMVMLKAKSSDWAKSVTTDVNGEFQFNAVVLGEYSVSVASKDFEQISQDVVVISFTFNCKSPRPMKKFSSPVRLPSSPPTASRRQPSSAASTSSALPAPTAPTAWP
jgi:hypothetical protein